MANKKAKIISALKKKNAFRQKVIVKENLKAIIENVEEIEKILARAKNRDGTQHLDLNVKRGEYVYGFTGDIIATYVDSQGNKYEMRILKNIK